MLRLSEKPYVFLKISFWASIASWVCLGVLLVANRFSAPAVATTAMFASVVCVTLSSICDVIGSRGYGEGRGVWDLIAPIMICVALAFVVYGYFRSDHDMMMTAVLCVFIFSFIPSFFELMGVGRPHRYVEHRHVSAEPYSYPPDPLSMFGMDTPKTPPPIIIEKGEDLDDDWMEYLGVSIPGSEQAEIEEGEVKIETVDVTFEEKEDGDDDARDND